FSLEKFGMPFENGGNTMLSARVSATFCRIILRSFGGSCRLPLPLGEGRGEGFCEGEARHSFSLLPSSLWSNPHPSPLPKGEGTNKNMKAKVYVTLKPSVLDPQGKAIKHSVELLGYQGISDIRQGKYFEIALDGGLTEDDARQEATRMAREILSNPIIEDFRVEIER